MKVDKNRLVKIGSAGEIMPPGMNAGENAAGSVLDRICDRLGPPVRLPSFYARRRQTQRQITLRLKMGYDLPNNKPSRVESAATKIILEFALDASNCSLYFGSVDGDSLALNRFQRD